ncbi:MAG TPA: FixH family protein [Pyrinomonadaceae bacterium]|nr:FixH family protein [Pyrinomonadaceae bacterium]
MLCKRNSTIALCACLLFAQACRQKTASPADVTLTLTHEISPQAPRVGPVAITLRLTDRSGDSVTGARIAIEGNMSHPGMTPVFAEARETEAGRYRATLELSMAGDWIVLVHASLADGRKVEQQFELKVST